MAEGVRRVRKLLVAVIERNPLTLVTGHAASTVVVLSCLSFSVLRAEAIMPIISPGNDINQQMLRVMVTQHLAKEKYQRGPDRASPYPSWWHN